MTDPKPIILIICDYYLPGFESGGGMRTLVNMVERLGDDFDFRIVTRDHDGPLDKTSYENVLINDWNTLGKAKVYYVSRDRVRAGQIKSVIAEVTPAAIYLNSFFSPLTISVLILRKLGRINHIPVILAPEGEFSAGALALKRVKKRLYLVAAKSLHLLAQVVWKAASESEVGDIHAVMGKTDRIFVAPNMPPKVLSGSYDPSDKLKKASGRAEMVFLSRFMRKKNFNWLLEHLGKVNGELQIDVYGPIEEADYREESRRLIDKLPSNVRIDFKGTVPHDQVSATLSRYHFFVLPTLGENFGHVFIEAFAAGCPVIVSDRTPWRDLGQKGIGWDIPLEDPAAWIKAVDNCIAMNGDEYAAMSLRSREFAVKWLSDPSIEASNREVLQAAIANA